MSISYNEPTPMPEKNQLKATIEGKEYLFVWGPSAWTFRASDFRELALAEAHRLIGSFQHGNRAIGRRVAQKIGLPLVGSTDSRSSSGTRPLPGRRSSSRTRNGLAVDLRVFLRKTYGWSSPKSEKEKEIEKKEPSTSLSEISVRVVRRDTGEPLAGQKFQMTLTNDQVKKGETDSDGWCEFRGIPPGFCDFKLIVKGWERSEKSGK